MLATGLLPRGRLLLITGILTVFLLSVTPIGFGQRAVNVYTDYPYVVIHEGKELSLELHLTNAGGQEEEVLLSVEGPDGWDARFETASYPTIQIGAVSLRPGQTGKDAVTIRFKARPPAGTPADTYTFVLRAKGEDGRLIREIPIEVRLKGEAPPEEVSTEEGLELTTDYPSLQGAPGDQVSFNVSIHNKASEERIVDLGANAPIGWRIGFVPRYQSQQITSIKVAGNGTETIRVQVTPPAAAVSGEVPIEFVARAGSVEERLDLSVTVLGTPDLKLGSEAEITGTGETRNINATEGRERTYTFYLWNEGTAPLHDLHLFASKPQDWEVTVEPERIALLEPISKTRKPEAITVKIRPRSRAIPGDYRVTVTAAAQEEHDHIDIRVSVGSSMKWGWIGVGVVLIVVAGLVGIFVRLGRR